MLGSGWNLPLQHEVCCRSQSEQGLQGPCVAWGRGEKASVSPGPSGAVISTSSKDDKTQGLSGRRLLERGVCRGELDLAIPGQQSVSRVLSRSALKQQPVCSCVFALGAGAVAARLASVLTCRQGGNSFPCSVREGIPFLLCAGAVHSGAGTACAQRAACAWHCGTARAAELSSSNKQQARN